MSISDPPPLARFSMSGGCLFKRIEASDGSQLRPSESALKSTIPSKPMPWTALRPVAS